MDEQIRAAIKSQFWPNLVRQLTLENVRESLHDPKLHSDIPPAIFLPELDRSSQRQARYYASEHVEFLPQKGKFNDDDFIKEVSGKPGLLALQFDGSGPMKYMVPGGRFNEFYGWDSYFIALGLINDNELELAGAIAHQFAFEIRNYGKILNANRPYYLGRTQPPFLSDLAWKLHSVEHNIPHFVDWIKAAMTEYVEVWEAEPRHDHKTKLFKYHSQGFGIPPETEAGHFDAVLRPYAQKHGLGIAEFIEHYNEKRIHEPTLDVYLLHDRSLRESGHDVSTRFVNCCADLVTVDLASLLYKYATDIARAIEKYPEEFGNENCLVWWDRAKHIKKSANKYLWNEEYGVFCDYNVRTRKQHMPVLSATTLWALWSGLANRHQAEKIRNQTCKSLEFEGGLSATSKIEGAWQWDYPAGWAPHQMLAWVGLENYGYTEDAKRLARKWMKTVVKGARQSGGALFEKYDIRGVENPQDLNAEYGNQGNKETGFGWTNSSFALAYDKYR